jgi:hypothetical protein
MELSDSERSINFPPKIRRDFDDDEDIECDNPEFQIHSDAFQDVSRNRTMENALSKSHKVKRMAKMCCPNRTK